MSDLEFSLTPWQQQVWENNSRFDVVAAGRRSGKTRLAIYKLLYHALQLEKGHVWYVAPTQGAARDILWEELNVIGRPIITKSHINNLQVTLVNGAKITLKGADRPETLRGVSLKYVVLDEYATMKPETWDSILGPALADQEGGALFIGTPAGRNHFFDLYTEAGGILTTDAVSAGKGENIKDEWTAWHFTSYDNPFVPDKEIEAAKERMSSFAFTQEFCASFIVNGSEEFREEWIKFQEFDDWKIPGQPVDYYIAADLAGFEEMAKSGQNARLDDSAIAIVAVQSHGWFVRDIIHGRWTLKETAEKLFNAVAEYKPIKFGIEKGISKQAVMSPLEDFMRQRGRYFKVEDLSHGNQRKTDRIMWALQGRFEHGKITLNKDSDSWSTKFLDQLFSFPNKLVHDDLIDALAYIDQMALTLYNTELLEDEDDDWAILDDYTGY